MLSIGDALLVTSVPSGTKDLKKGNEVIRIVRNVILFVLIVLAAVAILRSGLERAEKAECVGWIEMSQEQPDFYLTGWQAEQCKALGFDINQIPVK